MADDICLRIQCPRCNEFHLVPLDRNGRYDGPALCSDAKPDERWEIAVDPQQFKLVTAETKTIH